MEKENVAMDEPPSKRVKSGEEFLSIIEECYQIKFERQEKSEEDKDRFEKGIEKIRATLEQVKTSSDVTFGPTRSATKINWGKCLSLMLETGSHSLNALKILTDKLSPGGGLL